MNIIIRKSAFFTLITLIAILLSPFNSFATVSFDNATNSLNLVNTIEDSEGRVFVFGGIADGESSIISFTTDSTCPGVAMTGGAEFITQWTCADGLITATVTNRGGMSFGPATDETAGTFYVTFNNPPAPPGSDSAPAALSGIQISVFGDVSQWSLSGESTANGVNFGVELSGTQGGAAHFHMDLPQAAVDFLGGVLGVFVGGKADPFSGVTNNDDGSASIIVDIAGLSATASSSSKPGTNASVVTKKITAGARSLNIAYKNTKLKSRKSAVLAMCSGSEFTTGDKVPVVFTLGSKVVGIKKSFILDSTGCARTTVKLTSISSGKLTAKISYKGKKAKTTATVSK